MLIIKNLLSKNHSSLWIFLFCFLAFSSATLAISPTSFSPADNSTNVTTTQNLTITYDTTPYLYGMGAYFTIYNSGGTIFEQYCSAGCPGNLSVSGSVVTINPNTDFVAGNSYYITMDSGVVRDGSWNFNPTISGSTTWNFTVADNSPPTLSSTYPVDNATKILTSANLVMNFSKAIDIQTGNLTIKKTADDSIIETVAVSSAKVTGNGTTQITINPNNGLTAGTEIYVLVANGAFADLSGHTYAGISSTTAWSFTTWDGTTNWYNGSWAYRMKFTVQNSKVNGDLTDFPVMVNLNDLGSNFFSHVKSNGADIVVTDYTGNGKLARELESINTSAQTGVLWLKAPNLYNTSNSDFYIYYGYSSGAETNSTDTWKSSYQMVSHFAETPTSSDADAEFQDSTTNNKDGTSKGSMPTSNKILGQIGNGLKLDGSNDYVDYGNISTIDTKSKYTLSTWFKRTNTTSTMPIFNKGSSSSIIHVYNDGTYKLSENIYSSYETYSDAQDTNWHYLVNVFDGTASGNSNRFKLYIDGVEKTLTYNHSVAASSGGGGYNLYLGYHATMTVSTAYAPARFDEVHVSNGTYSAAWIKTEYDNQYSPSTFYTVASEEVFVDTTNPTVSTLSPADGETGVSTSANLVITFSEAVETQTGNIIIKRSSNGGTLQTIAVGSGYVTGNGTTSITINPPSDLATSNGYYINIDATAFDDLAGNSYAGISNSTDWNFTTEAAAGAWYSNNWTYRTKITVQNSKVNGDLASFPVMVNLNNLGSSFFTNVKSDGSDIVVTDSIGTKLSRELESINTTAQTGVLWFKAANLYNTSNSDFYIYYGYSSGAETNSTSTWKSSYQVVSHFAETPTSSDADAEFQDSTTNNKDGTSKGSMPSSNKIAGQIGNGLKLDGSNDYVDYGNISAIDTKTKYTLSTWFKRTNTSSTMPIFDKGSSSSIIHIYNDGTYKLSENTYSSYETYSDAQDTNWHYIVNVFDGTASGNSNRFKLYIDGAEKTLSYNHSVAASSGGGGSSLYLGYHSTMSVSTAYAPARFDEVHISNGTYSAAWIKTEYDNQYSPSTFYTVSTQESSAGADTTNPSISSFSPADNATGVAVNSNLVMNFDESVTAQSGNINIYTGAGTLFASMAVGSGNVSGSGTSTITINPSSDLTNATSYYVTVDATAFDDTSGNSYAGISSANTWNFVTVASGGGDVTGPSVSYFSPPDNARFVQSYSSISMVFDEAVQAGSGNVVIKKSSDDTVLSTMGVNSSYISGWGTSTITIKPSTAFTNDTGYYVQVDTGSILDLSGNSFSGISNNSTWNFNTQSSPSSFTGGDF